MRIPYGAVLPAAMFACLLNAIAAPVSSSGALDPIVPIKPDMADAKTLAEDLCSAHGRWGLRRFVLTGPQGLVPESDIAGKFRRMGERIAEVRSYLSGTDIELGWWFAPTLRQGWGASGQHVVDCDGHSSSAVCPLDKDVVKCFAEGVATVCRVGRPFIVFFEDDYELMWHHGMNGLGGCFCERHLALFAERYGRRLSAAEIAYAFRNRTAENEPMRIAFAEVQKASLVSLARAIRRAIDEVNPAIRTCLCQSGRVDLDGDTTEVVARAFAGGTRPAVRLFGARYCNDNFAVKLPQTLSHTAWSAATLPKDFELLHESDPYPHSRFFGASAYLGSEIACAFMCGVNDSFFYCSQYLDDPFEDGGHADWFSRNRRRLEVVRDFRSKAHPVGVRVSYDPKEQYLVREAEPGKKLDFLGDGANFLGRLGFPYTAAGGDVTILSSQSVGRMGDEEIRKTLSGGVFLDGAAAHELSKRGFNDLIGVEPERVKGLPFMKERILPAAGCRKRGKIVTCWTLEPLSGMAAGTLLKLVPLPGAEVWSEYVGPDEKSAAPSVTYFRNPLGGRVAVLAHGLSGISSTSVYSSRKQELFANLFRKLSDGRLDVCAPETPCTWVLACVSEDGGEMVVMVNNLAGETRDDIALRLSDRWRGAEAARLGMDGAWQPMGTVDGSTWRPSMSFHYLSPEFLLFRQPSNLSQSGERR